MFAVRPLVAAAAVRSAVRATTTTTTRAFSVLQRVRPTLAAGAFRSSLTLQPTGAPSPSTVPSTMPSTPDVVAPSSISRHPAFAGIGSQIRCGPRPTMSGATRLVQKRRNGFLSRVRTRTGRKTLARRRQKGRKRLSA